MNPDKKISLSIVVPCYNEEKNIPLILKRFKEAIKQEDIELILVNNGSTDNSNQIIQELSLKYPFVRTTLVPINQGYGFGILSGLREANGEYICWTHADMQTDPVDAIKAFDIIKKQKNPEMCFIKGNRKKRPLIDTFFQISMSIFETTILRKMLYDINAQPNLFHKSFLKKIKNPPYDFSLDLFFYYIAKKEMYKIVRFPVLFSKRIYGESHWNTSLKSKWKFIKRTLDFTIKLKRRMKKNN